MKHSLDSLSAPRLLFFFFMFLLSQEPVLSSLLLSFLFIFSLCFLFFFSSSGSSPPFVCSPLPFIGFSRARLILIFPGRWSSCGDRIWDSAFWLDWDTNSPAIAGLLVVVSSTRQWLVMAAKDTETNCEAGDGSRGHCNVSGGVSCLSGCHSVFPSQVVSSVFRGRRRRMEMTKRRRFWRGGHFSIWSLKFPKFSFKPLIF